MDIESITQLRMKRDDLRKSLSGIKVSHYAGEKFGKEQEYVAKGLVAGVDAILVDISGLTKSPSKFIQKSTHLERTQLSQFLSELNTYASSNNLQAMAVTIDKIKPVLRSFGIRYTTERLDVFEDHLNNLQKNASCLSEHISDVTDIKSGSEELKEEIDTVHEQLINKLEELKEQEGVVQKLITSTEEDRNELALMLTTDKSRSD